MIEAIEILIKKRQKAPPKNSVEILFYAEG